MKSASKRCIRALALGFALLACAAAAHARSELLRWQHAVPATVAGFKVYVGNASGSYQTTLDVGMPSASGGVFSYALQIPDPDSAYVAVSAYGPTGLEGARSNEQLRPGMLGTPGKPQIQP